MLLRAASRSHRRAVLLLSLSSLLFGAMAFAAKLAAERLGGAQVAFVRFAVGALPLLVAPGLWRSLVRARRRDLLFYRGFFGATAVLLYFLALQHVPAGVATLLNYTAPVFSVAFAHRFLGEPFEHRLGLPLATALVGVALVVRSHPSPAEWLGLGLWEAVALASAVLSGAAVTAIRAARRTERSWSVFASFTLLGLVITAPFGLAGWVPPTPTEWALLGLVGASSLAAQLLMTHAYRWIDNLRAGVLAQLAVVVAMVLEVTVGGQAVDTRRVLGTLLTLGSVAAVVALGAPAAPMPGTVEASPLQASDPRLPRCES